MKTILIDYTGAGTTDPADYAASILIFTKNTRLQMAPGLLDDIRSWSMDKKLVELEYASKTIKSSWEMLSLTFLIQDVTRATAQQITRTRNASYAMQSQRVTDVRNIGVKNNVSDTNQHDRFDDAVTIAIDAYSQLVDNGVPLEDARGILPMNTLCNLVAKYNFRALTDLIKSRKSMRAQGEYNEMAKAMEAEVIRVWPWSASFFKSDHDVAIAMLEKVAKEIGIITGQGHGWDIAKAIDLIR